MKRILVTDVENESIKCLLPLAYIIWIHENENSSMNKGSKTCIKVASGETRIAFYVKETVEEIDELIAIACGESLSL